MRRARVPIVAILAVTAARPAVSLGVEPPAGPAGAPRAAAVARAPSAGAARAHAPAAAPAAAGGQPVPAPARQEAGTSRIDALLGQRVVSVRLVEGEREVTDADVRRVVVTQPGDRLAMAAVRETEIHLASLGRYADVAVEAEAVPGGVALVYRLTPTVRLTGVEIRGRSGVPARRLRAVALGRLGDRPAALSRADDAARAVEGVLRDRGYFDGRVGVTIEPEAAPGRARLVLTVEAGPRYRVGQVSVSGLPPGDAAAVRARLGLHAGAPWDAARLAARTARYAGELRRRGYYRAAVSADTVSDPRTARVDVIVEVDRGPLVTLEFDAEDLDRRELEALVPVRREGSVDEDLLEDSKRRIEARLHAQGYRLASVDYTRREEDGQLRLVFTVRKGPLFLVDGVDITGAVARPAAELVPLVRLREGAPFVEATLEADVARIAQSYHEAGFIEAKVTSVVAEAPGDRGGAMGGAVRHVRPRIVIDEGRRITIGRVGFRGQRQVAEADLWSVVRLRPGGPFSAAQLVADRNTLQDFYRNRGFQDATVEVLPVPSGAPGVVDVTFDIAEGTQAVVDHVIVSGNTRTSSRTILGELPLGPGDPIGLDDLAESQRRLSALGLFRRVTVEDLDKPGSPRRDVLVRVEEAPATSLGYGAGLEVGRRFVRDPASGEGVERIDAAPRGFFEVGRRNLWGKNRSVSLFTRAGLRRRGGSALAEEPGRSGFIEYRVIGTYREPRLLGTGADAQVSAFAEQGVRSSFNFRRIGVNTELARRLTPSVTVTARHAFGDTRLFDERFNPAEKPVIDRLFPQVRLSTISAGVIADTRDDPIDPARGHLLGLQGDLAGQRIGSEVGYVKSFAQGFVYRRVPGTRVVFAGGVRLGLATGFPREVEVIGPDGRPTIDRVKDLPASERFYTGGDSTVRGYNLDRLGDEGTIDRDGFPLGGDALVVLNGELRVPLTRVIGAVAFLDAGNVFARVGDFDLGRIKASAGGGLRYRSPVGPIRVDIGVKFDPRTFASGQRERRWEIHVSLGQAF
jgi:outer membrane protein insertion porin family